MVEEDQGIVARRHLVLFLMAGLDPSKDVEQGRHKIGWREVVAHLSFGGVAAADYHSGKVVAIDSCGGFEGRLSSGVVAAAAAVPGVEIVVVLLGRSHPSFGDVAEAGCGFGMVVVLPGIGPAVGDQAVLDHSATEHGVLLVHWSEMEEMDEWFVGDHPLVESLQAGTLAYPQASRTSLQPVVQWFAVAQSAELAAVVMVRRQDVRTFHCSARSHQILASPR